MVWVVVDSCLADRLFLSRVRRVLKPCSVARGPGRERLLAERGLLLEMVVVLYKWRRGRRGRSRVERGSCPCALRDPLDIVFVRKLLFLLEKVVVEAVCL